MTLLFVLALGLELGVYSMLPSYLVLAHGIEQSMVNGIVAGSRLTSLLMVFGSGWLSDHLGYKRVLAGTVVTAGLVTATLGFASGWPLIVAVYLQPMLVSGFFPAGLTAMAGISTPENRNLVVSLVIPIAYLLGAGLIPTALGVLAELGLYGVGYIAVGLAMSAAVVLVPRLD